MSSPTTGADSLVHPTGTLTVTHQPRSTPGPGNTVWLASFPKSGNTWVRAIVTALNTPASLFAVNHLGSGAQPHHVRSSLALLGLDSRWLAAAELPRVRDWQIRRSGDPRLAGDDRVFLRKTHEHWRPGPEGAEPFPVAATRAAILIVRDPRDVACSYAPFFGVTPAAAVAAMAAERPDRPSPARQQTGQPWGSWSSHAASWLSDQVPFPVHLVRYEDLVVDATAALLPALTAAGVECTEAELADAVARSSFERLQTEETQRGFRETSHKAPSFFRTGRSGDWRDSLAPDLVAAVEADHAPMMQRLGYALTTDRTARLGLAQARRSRRRQERAPWWHLPAHLGIDVTVGKLPNDLPGAQQPRRWIRTTPDETLVRFAGGAGVHVRAGRHVTVELPEQDLADGADPSWLLQGWAVTLAFLQRGQLSLHAAVLELDHADGTTETVAVAGHRGAGKSTTSMALRAAGHRLLVDDVCLLTFAGDEALVQPYSRNVHLLPDAAAMLGLDFDDLPLLTARTKAAFRPEDPPEQPVRLNRIVVLEPSETPVAVTRRDVRGAARIATLVGHTSRDGLARLVLGDDRYFQLLARLAAAAPVQVVQRHLGTPSLPEVTDAVIAGRA